MASFFSEILRYLEIENEFRATGELYKDPLFCCQTVTQLLIRIPLYHEDREPGVTEIQGDRRVLLALSSTHSGPPSSKDIARR